MELMNTSYVPPSMNNSNEYQKTPCTWTQFFVAIALASLVASFSTTSYDDVMVLAGGIVGGLSIHFLGRIKPIAAIAIAHIVACMLIACSDKFWVLTVLGESITHFCVGVAIIAVPIYLCESIQPEVRGTLALLPKCFTQIGALLHVLTGRYIHCPLASLCGIIISVLFLISIIIIPDTPRWFVSKKKQERARTALQWLRGKKADVEPELKDIVKSHVDAVRYSSEICVVQLLIYNLKPFLIALGLMFFQNFCGINFLMFYAIEMFMYAGLTLANDDIVWVFGAVNLLAILIAMILIDRLGRKILFYISLVGMIIALTILGGYFYVKRDGHDVSHVHWLASSSVILYTFCFSLGFGCMSFLIMAEILPTKIRGSTASVVIAFKYLCDYLATYASTYFATFGYSSGFWFFSVMCALGLLFVIYCLPEFKGKTLEDIEREFTGRTGNMSFVDNIPPLLRSS